MPDAKEVYGTLLNDERFWQQDVPTRLQIIDFAANDNVSDDMPDDQLMGWSQNRFKARAVSRIGKEQFNQGIDLLGKDPSVLPPQFQDEAFQADLNSSQQLPYGQQISLSPQGTAKSKAIEGFEQGVAAPQEAQIPIAGDESIKLKFVPHPTKFLLDVETPAGTKRHKFNSFDEVPKDGESMTKFLADNYGNEFGVGDGLIEATGSQVGSTWKRALSEASRFIGSIPSSLEMTAIDLLMEDKGKEFTKNNTVDAQGNLIPMPKDLSNQLWDRAKILAAEANKGDGTPEAIATEGMGGVSAPPQLSLDEAFVLAHRQYLDGMEPIDVTGTAKGKTPEALAKGYIKADDKFSVFEHLKASSDLENPNTRDQLVEKEADKIYFDSFKANPDAIDDSPKPTMSLDDARKLAEQSIDKNAGTATVFRAGDKVKPFDILSANASLQDAPKARALYKAFNSQIENVRAIDDWYGKSAAQTLRESRDGLVQTALNFQQDVAGVIGQAAPALAANVLIPGSGAASMATRALAAAPGVVGGYSANLSESANSIFEDQITNGKTTQEAILKAVDGAIASSAAATPLDAIGEIVLAPAVSKIGDAFRSLSPASKTALAKELAAVIDPEIANSGVRHFAQEALVQMASEGGGEFTRATVADQFKDSPDGVIANLKNAGYEALLAPIVGASIQGGANIAGSLSEAINNARANRVGADPVQYANIQKLPPQERQAAMRDLFDVKEDQEYHGLPPITANGAPLVPVGQNITVPSSESTPTAPAETPPVAEEEREAEREAVASNTAASDAFTNAEVTNDESELAAMQAIGIKAGDVIDVQGQAVRVLGAPLSEDGISTVIRGITPQGQEVSIPEGQLGDIQHVSVAEGESIRSAEDANAAAPPLSIDLPDSPTAPSIDPPVEAPTESPRVAFKGSRMGGLDYQVSPDTVNFAQSRGINLSNFGVGENGTVTFSRGNQPLPANGITIQLNPPAVEGEAAEAPAAPFQVERDYDQSANALGNWARAEGYWTGETAALGDFMASSNINPQSVLGDGWENMGQYVNDLPVMLVDGKKQSGLKAFNLRISNGAGGVLDGVIIPRDKWNSMPPAEKSVTLIHEVLHSSIGDWMDAARGPLATTEMTSLLGEMDEIGSTFFKTAKAASTPIGKSFRNQFASIFESGHYNPENPHDLVEELVIRGLTDDRARAMMQMVTPDMKPIEAGDGEYVPSLWDRVMDFFRRMVGWNSTRPEQESLFDRFVSIHQRMNEQRSTITLTPRYTSSEAVDAKADDIGLAAGSYSAIGNDGSFRLQIGEAGMSRIRSAQKVLDEAVAIARTPVAEADVREVLPERIAAFKAAQNSLAEAQEAFMNSMADTTALNVIMSPDQLVVASDETYNRMVQSGEQNVSNRFVLRGGAPSTLLENLTDAGKHQQDYLRGAINDGLSYWSAGFRSFPAWQAKMTAKYPNAPVVAMWDRLQSSVADVLNNLGANGVVSYKVKGTDPTSLARQDEYKSFLRNPSVEGVQTFVNEALRAANTKLAKSSREALFSFGPLATRRNQFIAIRRNENGSSALAFNEDAYNREYQAASKDAERNKYRLRDLDGIPDVIRETKERIRGTKKAKAQIQNIFTDVAGRLGIDRAGAGHIWSQIILPQPVTSSDMGAAIDGAIQRAVDQFGLSPAKVDDARKQLKAYAKEMKKAFRKAHQLSPERILDEPKAKEIADAARSYAMMLGRSHGFSAANVAMENGFGAEYNPSVADQLANAAPYLVEGKPFALDRAPGFDAATIQKLLGYSLDFSYLRAFIEGARSSFYRAALDQSNNQELALSRVNSLVIGNTADFENLLVGGIDFNGKDLFNGLIGPVFDTVARYGNGRNFLNSLAIDTEYKKYPAKVLSDRKKVLSNQYEAIMKNVDAQKVRQQILNDVTWRDDVFLRSFDPRGLGMADTNTTPESIPNEAGAAINAITPGRASSVLKDLQDLRGGLRINQSQEGTAWMNNMADFAEAREQSTRSERRDEWSQSNEKRLGKEDYQLKQIQTKALLLLAEGDKPTAMAMARQILAQSVNDSGVPSYDRVTEILEDMLLEQAGNENNAAFVRQKTLPQVMPRLEQMVPLSPQRLRLALADGGAEMSNMADVIEMFAMMDDSSMGSELANFLRGNTRPLPVLLLDTQRMSEESRQAFRESDLLRKAASSKQDANTEIEAGYQGEFVAVDIGQLGDNKQQPVNRLLAESIRDALSQEGTKYLNEKAQNVFTSMDEAVVNLDHGLQMLNMDIENGVRTPLLRDIAEVLNKTSEKWGGFNRMGTIPFAVEVLSNSEFRQALALLPSTHFDVPSRETGTIGKILDAKAAVIADSDLNDASRKMLDYGQSFDEIAEQESFDDDGFTMGPAFDGYTGNPYVDAPTTPNFLQLVVGNSLELMWTANQMASLDTLTDQAPKFIDTIPELDTVENNTLEAGIAALTLDTEGSATPEATAAYQSQLHATGAVLRSLKSRIGKSVDEWVAEYMTEDQPAGTSVQELPGANAKEIAWAYQVKAMAATGGTNPLFSGTKFVEADVATRAVLAKEFAQDYWTTIMGSAELAPIMRDIQANPYSNKWMQESQLKWLEDLASYMMAPEVSDGVRGQIWSAVARGFSPDPTLGGPAQRIGDMQWHILYDKWRELKAKSMGAKFLTDTRFNPVEATTGFFSSLQKYAHNDAIYRIYGAASPALMSNILDTMAFMDFGVTGTQGHNGFKSKMVAVEDRFTALSNNLIGAYKAGYVRATLAGNLTQYALNGDPATSVANTIEALEKSHANLLVSGKSTARRSWNLRNLYRQELDRFIPIAQQFAGGALTQGEYEIAIDGLLKPNERTWLKEVRGMFNEVRPAMEVASRLLGREMGNYTNYIPMMNGRVNNEMGFVDNMFRPVGQKVGTSRARSTNERFSQGETEQDYMMDLDGSQMINMLRRDMFMLETVSGGLLLHELLGTRNDKGGRYEGTIEKKGKSSLAALDYSKLDVTLRGLRMVYDRTRTGMQSGLNIDNRVRRILNTAQQIGAYKTLADLEQIPKQTIPGMAIYAGRIAGSLATGDANPLRASLAATASVLRPQLRANMVDAMKAMAPAIYARGADGNHAFKEKMALELRAPINSIFDVVGIAKNADNLALGAVRWATRNALEYTVGKWDAMLTAQMFYSEYGKRAMAAGLSFESAFDKSNWNPRWARDSKQAAEEIMGTSAIEERGSVMQMKGSSVGSEFSATVLRAYGIHNISLAAHARALGNEIMNAPSLLAKAQAVGKLAEIGVQQAIFNALGKSTRDLLLSHIIALIPGVDKDQEDIYHWLLNDWPLDKRTTPTTSGYDYMQARGWKTLFDSTPMLGSYGAALSLPILNDLVRAMAEDGFLKPQFAQLNDEQYKPFQQSRGEVALDTITGMGGYVGGAAESVWDSVNAAKDHPGMATLALLAPRGVSARIFQDIKGQKKEKPKASASDVLFGY